MYTLASSPYTILLAVTLGQQFLGSYLVHDLPRHQDFLPVDLLEADVSDHIAHPGPVLRGNMPWPATTFGLRKLEEFTASSLLTFQEHSSMQLEVV